VGSIEFGGDAGNTIPQFEQLPKRALLVGDHPVKASPKFLLADHAGAGCHFDHAAIVAAIPLGLKAKLASAHQLRQLGDIHRNPPRLIARHEVRRQAPPGFVLEMDVGERVVVGIADNVAILAEPGVRVIDRPGRWEAAGLIRYGAGRWHFGSRKAKRPRLGTEGASEATAPPERRETNPSLLFLMRRAQGDHPFRKAVG